MMISFALVLPFQFEELEVICICNCKGALFKVLFLAAPGITLFIILPSAVFYFVESGWSYLDCVYYAFVSLTTIGYGDLYNEHHGKEVEAQLGVWIWAYQVSKLCNKCWSSVLQYAINF